ncbi:L-aspartate--glyoxylate aminotransferase BhcA [Ahrensia sp. R2A130]|uniref:L-aspartate--glyoxylate aminotransferase BhcA n=1 Tax=Ahrensia sp. R2A130 TaxID=744979 RepID=UPI0001E0D0F7|nr:L-aspartate--glyoxylate aminotransferase BhcA [Ahrensia sp. R2A130]EFL89280.1 serine--glyoxylate aminotransferase [Ahrensia sp. R2A130]
MSMQNPVFIPGPTNIPDELRRVIDFGTIDHRSSVFDEMLAPAIAGVKRILKTTDGEALVFPSTGTGAWEAAISNTLSPGDKVLVGCWGMFSHRWIDMCERHGLNVIVAEANWGDGVPLNAYAAALEGDTGHAIKAVLATHNETATGVKSDISAVRAVMNKAKHPALLMVDGVSSIASMDFRMDEWGVDLAIAGSQKGFMLPPGLAILGISQKAIAAMETAKLPRTFFDFRDMLTANGNGSFPYTPPVQLIRGLDHAIAMLESEGLDAVFARHARLAQGVREAVNAWCLKLCATSPDLYSDTVSAVLVPDGFDGTKVVTHAAEKYGVAFGVGLGEVSGKLFRIGHLGMLTDVMMCAGLSTAEMTMLDLGFPIKAGSGVTAAQEYYRNNPVATAQPMDKAA